MTTTSKKVANVCAGKDGPIYKMKPLDENSATDLLASKVPKLSGNTTKMILKTCEGLPLAIANFGDYIKMLNLESEYYKLKDECISISSLFVNNDNDEAFPGMKHVVNRSHTSLDADAKACFLSLSIYSKNLVTKNT